MQAQQPETPWDELRARMVAHVRRMGVHDPSVLAAMDTVPRHRFVPVEEQAIAYTDRPLPIGYGQTISQPYMVARMAELLGLSAQAHVLDVGTGSGYAAAVYSRIAARVISLERIPQLAARARAVLAELGYTNVQVVEADGTQGYAAAAPYEAIGVAATAPEIPHALLEQLTERGRLVIPVGTPSRQHLLQVTRQGGLFTRQVIAEVAFVPLIGSDEEAAKRARGETSP